jgi:hypothetical protein
MLALISVLWRVERDACALASAFLMAVYALSTSEWETAPCLLSS